MDTGFFLGFLSIFTLVAVLVLALVSRSRAQKRRDDEDAPKSRLAKDAPDTWSRSDRT